MIYYLNSMCLNCMYIYVCSLYMTIVHSSTVAVILCQLPATSYIKTVGGMCYVILDAIGLTFHHGTNYKLPPIMAKLTTDILE